MAMIPLSEPEIRGKEWAYLKECLDTNWVSSAGPFVDRFEQMMADCIGTRFAMDWRLTEAAERPRMLIAVSRLSLTKAVCHAPRSASAAR